jgi:hypothetical protein
MRRGLTERAQGTDEEIGNVQTELWMLQERIPPFGFTSLIVSSFPSLFTDFAEERFALLSRGSRELEKESSPLHAPLSPSSSDVDVVDELMTAFAFLEASRDRTLLSETDGSTRGKSFRRNWRKFSTRSLRIWSELLRDDGNRFRDSGFPDAGHRVHLNEAQRSHNPDAEVERRWFLQLW